MQSNKDYKAGAELVRRAGLEKDRFMTKDGHFIISEGDLRFMASRGVITPEEFITGLDLEIVTPEESQALIQEGGYNLSGEPLPEPKEEKEEVETKTTTKKSKK